MSDELTPEELEALKNLPRERMPSARLEERVVGAMREHGILATKPGRVVRLTNSRFAGLIAATVVLMVGAYSIGLHRGGENEVIRGVQTPPGDVSTLLSKEETAPTLARESASEPARGRAIAKSEPQLEWKLKTSEKRDDNAVPAERAERADKDIEPQTSPPVSDEVSDAVPLKQGDSGGALKRQNQPTPPSAPRMKYDALQSRSGLAASPGQSVPRFFRLGSTSFIIEAPDSVRIVQDETGRVLLIYTSDGILRIRLAE